MTDNIIQETADNGRGAKRGWDFFSVSQNIVATVVSTALVATVVGWYRYSGTVDSNAYAVTRNSDAITRLTEQQEWLTDALDSHVAVARGLYMEQRSYVDDETEKLDTRLRECQRDIGALDATVEAISRK